MYQEELDFNGPAYERDKDKKRLTGHIFKIFTLMSDGEWRTLDEISSTTRIPQASASAFLRHLRKHRFGAHNVLKQRRGDPSDGLWEYKLLVNRNFLKQF